MSQSFSIRLSIPSSSRVVSDAGSSLSDRIYADLIMTIHAERLATLRLRLCVCVCGGSQCSWRQVNAVADGPTPRAGGGRPSSDEEICTAIDDQSSDVVKMKRCLSCSTSSLTAPHPDDRAALGGARPQNVVSSKINSSRLRVSSGGGSNASSSSSPAAPVR